MRFPPNKMTGWTTRQSSEYASEEDAAKARLVVNGSSPERHYVCYSNEQPLALCDKQMPIERHKISESAFKDGLIEACLKAKEMTATLDMKKRQEAFRVLAGDVDTLEECRYKDDVQCD